MRPMVVPKVPAGYIKNLVNNVTWTGSVASTLSSLNWSVGCNANGEIQIVQQGQNSTNYENIVFSLSSAPSGVTLKGNYSTTPSASNIVSQMYGCIIQGLTGPVNLTFTCNTQQATYDYNLIAITVAYV
jgi:hypothetical protein